MAVPYTFATATGSLPLSQLDSNFSTAITIGNTAVVLGDTITTVNNLSLANVAITSVSTAFPNGYLANSNVIVGTTTLTLGSTVTSINGLSLSNVTISSGNVTISNVTTTNVTATTANVTTANVGTLTVIGNTTAGGNVTITGNVSAANGTFTSANVSGTANVSTLAVVINATIGGNATVTGNVSMNVATITTANVSGTANISTLVITANQTSLGNITATGNVTAAKLIPTGSSVTGNGLYLPAANALGLSTNGVEAMRVDASGNLLVGTTSPGGKLAVQCSASGIAGYFSDATNSSLAIATLSGGVTLGTDSGGSIHLATNGSAAVNRRLSIDSSGNVGIGTTAPTKPLTVKAASADGVGVRLFANASEDVILDFYSASGATQKASVSSDINSALKFNTVSTERMRIDSIGNLLVGTTTATSVFTVASSGANIGYFNSTAANGSYSLWANSSTQNGGVGSAKGLFGGTLNDFAVRAENNLIFGVSSNERMRIDSAGNVQVQAGAVMPYAPAPAGISAAATLTNANIQGQIISATGTTYTITMALGTTLETLATWATTNIGYDFFVINTATGVITMAVNTGVTSLGSLTVAIGASAHFRLRRTAANTFVMYRLV